MFLYRLEKKVFLFLLENCLSKGAPKQDKSSSISHIDMSGSLPGELTTFDGSKRNFEKDSRRMTARK